MSAFHSRPVNSSLLNLNFLEIRVFATHNLFSNWNLKNASYMYFIVVKMSFRYEFPFFVVNMKWLRLRCLKMKWFFLVMGTWFKFLSYPSSPDHIQDVLFKNFLGFWDTDSFPIHYVLWSRMKFWEIVDSWLLRKEVLNHISTEWSLLEQTSVAFSPHYCFSESSWELLECSFNHT